tara:strand:+ start:18214 stop:18684 length:471 start_codon:yes stop_codon:yes gene_type:complete
MSRDNKTFNLREGAFPIKMDLAIEDIELQNIGKLKDDINANIEISLISNGLFHCEGLIKTVFVDKCQFCLKDIEVNLDFTCNLVIKDENIMMEDSSNQDQTHYQDLEYFDIKQLIEEEVSLNYPNTVKCEGECLEINPSKLEGKNLPFKKIRDLID